MQVLRVLGISLFSFIGLAVGIATLALTMAAISTRVTSAEK